MRTFWLVFGLGLAGIDPVGLSILIASIASGAHRLQVFAYALAVLIGTVILGVGLSLFGETFAQILSSYIPDANDPKWAIVEIVVGAIILYWLARRLFPPVQTTKKRDASRPRGTSTIAVTLTGLAFSLSALTDPTFFAAAAVASQAENVVAMAGLHLLWALVSQLPLFAFAAAFLLNIHDPMVSYVQPISDKVKKPAIVALCLMLALVALLMLSDAGHLFMTGEYLIPL